MATLISWQSSGGSKGRCDAKCYDAANETCNCICGGKNHGAGRARAEKNTRELAESWMEAMSAQRPGETIGFDVPLQQRGFAFAR